MLVGNKWKFWVSNTFEISLTLPWIVQPAMLAAVVTKQSVCSSMVVWFTCNKCRNIWLIIGQHYYMRDRSSILPNLLWLEKNYTHDRIIGQAFFGFWIHSKNVSIICQRVIQLLVWERSYLFWFFHTYLKHLLKFLWMELWMDQISVNGSFLFHIVFEFPLTLLCLQTCQSLFWT